MEELGRALLEERKARNISLDDISKSTHIAISVLKDIEAGNFHKYKGDEQYIKMYLKKYANYLNIDSTKYIESYEMLTREIQLDELKSATTKKSSNCKRNVKSCYTPTRKVYENHLGLHFIRYVIIALLVIFIVVMVWYGIKLSRSLDNSSFSEPSNTHVIGDVGQIDSINENTDTSSDSNTNEQTDEKTKLSIQRIAPYTFNVVVPSSEQKIEFKIDFGSKTWSQLTVNDQIYPDFKAQIYGPSGNEPFQEVVLEFDVATTQKIELRNGNNVNHHYYINGVEVDLSQDEEKPAPQDIIFNIIKE